jgi:hypothetical protein
MPSEALRQIPSRIKDIEELLEAHKQVGKGRRWARGTGAINRAAILLLTSHLEGFIEDLFVEAFQKLFPGRNPRRFVKYFNTPKCDNIDDLYEFLGLNDVTSRISFTPVSNKKVKEAIDSLVKLRHEIVHGQLTRSYVVDVRSWRGYLSGISRELDKIVASHLKGVLGVAPW